MNAQATFIVVAVNDAPTFTYNVSRTLYLQPLFTIPEALADDVDSGLRDVSCNMSTTTLRMAVSGSLPVTVLANSPNFFSMRYGASRVWRAATLTRRGRAVEQSAACPS